MTLKEKAKELFYNYNSKVSQEFNSDTFTSAKIAKECAIICVKNEYEALRELLFNLKSSRVIENNNVYLHTVQNLIDQEKELLTEIENL